MGSRCGPDLRGSAMVSPENGEQGMKSLLKQRNTEQRAVVTRTERRPVKDSSKGLSHSPSAGMAPALDSSNEPQTRTVRALTRFERREM